MSGDKVKIGPRVQRETYERFVSFVIEKHGSKNGNLGRELEKAMESWSSETDVDVMERRLASMEDQVDALVDVVSRLDRERENDTSSASDGSYNARTERKVDAIEESLPEGTDVDDDIVEHVIEQNAGTARKTVKKYKKLLRNRGIAFPDPAGGDVSELDPDAWVVGQSKLALRLESMDVFTPNDVDRVVGFYDQYLGENWYLDALPNDWLESNESKLERADDGSGKSKVEEYRRVHGLLDADDHGRTFQ